MSAAPALQSSLIPSIPISAATPPWNACGGESTAVACVCSSISFRITPRRIMPGSGKHPEFYVHGTEEQLEREPQNYTRIVTAGDSAVLAYGRDPYFDGWPDTLQLNYAEPALQEAMASELERIAGMCDGVRCDMAMLVLPHVFERTWGLRSESFWPKAIQRARSRNPGFLFMAEVYWDLEWTLQQEGFDYTYDKRLYDRLCEGHARPVREHFCADMDFQRRSARFLENHDEPRAAATFPPDKHKAAAVLTFLCPGLRFIHQGQTEGRTKKIPVHLARGPEEPVNPALGEFYRPALPGHSTPRGEDGRVGLLECKPAWEGNWTWDCFICFAWQDSAGTILLVVVNYAPNQSQCYVRFRSNRFRESMSAWRISFVRRPMTGKATRCCRKASSWISPPGATTSSS